MKKLDIFEMTLDNGVDTAYGVVIDTVRIDGDELDTKYTHLCYCQNRLFYYIEEVAYCGVEPDTHEAMYETTYKRGNTVIDYVVLPDYDACLQNWIERQKMNHRMILLETTSGISIEQEVAICEAIGKILSPGEKHTHVMFDRHFADKELCDKYNLVYTTIDE